MKLGRGRKVRPIISGHDGSVEHELPPARVEVRLHAAGMVLNLSEADDQPGVPELAVVQDAFLAKDMDAVRENLAVFHETGESTMLIRIKNPSEKSSKLVAAIHTEAGRLPEDDIYSALQRRVPVPMDVAECLGLGDPEICADVYYGYMDGADVGPVLMQLHFNLNTPVPDGDPVSTPYMVVIATNQNPSEFPPAT